MKRILGILLCLLVGSEAFAQITPYATAPTVAYLTANTFQGVAGVQLLGYNVAGDAGAGTFVRNGTSCTADSGTILKDAGGNCFYRTGAPFSAVSLEWFGAYGDATSFSTGTANSTTTFTDSTNGACATQLAAGRTHIVLFPQPGTSNAQVNTTIASCTGAATYTLTAGPSWSSSGNVLYVVGHDDGAAWTAASTFIGAVANGAGRINLNSAKYLVTSLASGLGTYSSGLVGLAGSPSIIVVAGLSAADGISFNLGTTANLSNFELWCGFAGNDCIDLVSAVAGTRISNIGAAYAQRDCLTMDGGNGTGLESVKADTITLTACGRHGWSVAQTGSAYFNISDFHNLNIRLISQRGASGTCIEGLSTGESLGNSLSTVECDAGYSSSLPYQSTYLPLPNAIYFNANGWGWNFSNLAIENTGAMNVCSGQCESVAVNYGAGVILLTTICNVVANSFWATISHSGQCYNAAGVLTLTGSGGNAVIAKTQANFTANFDLYVNNFVSSAGSAGQWRVVSAGGGTPVLTQIGTTATTGGGSAFTPSVASSGAVISATVTNNASSASTMAYTILNGNIVTFNTN